MDKVIERTNIIGGEWIYYKIYSGVDTADEIIKIVNEIALKLFDQKVIELWFFIRYADPTQHLRIRFKSLVCDCLWFPLSSLLKSRLNLLVRSIVRI